MRLRYPRPVRPASIAALLLPLALAACPSEETGGLEASVVRVQLTVDPMRPDSLANLDLTVELRAHGRAEEAALSRATITQQPVSDSSPSLDFEAHMINTQGDDPIVRIAAGGQATVRILNDGTTNDDLAAWCRLPVRLEVVVETADGEEASAEADAMVNCS